MVGGTSSIERSTVETLAATVASTTEPTAGTTVAVTASPVDLTAAGTVSFAGKVASTAAVFPLLFVEVWLE